MIARELGLPPDRVRRVEIAGILHDIGKIGLPDAILQKPGKLGKAELAEIRTHPEIGGQILSGRGLEDLRALGDGAPRAPRREGLPARPDRRARSRSRRRSSPSATPTRR